MAKVILSRLLHYLSNASDLETREEEKSQRIMAQQTRDIDPLLF